MKKRFVMAAGFAAATLSILGCSHSADDLMSPSAHRGGRSRLVSVTATEPQTGESERAAECRPLSAEKVSREIGPAGGRIATSRYFLDVPAGALARTVVITAEQVADTVNSVRFGPEGLQFAKPARLRMHYDNCAPPPVPGLVHRIIYVDESLRLLEVRPSVDLEASKVVEAPIDHFSRYAVAW